MRLIDADALMPRLEFIREAEHQIFYGKESWGFVSKCITAVEDAPTIEPERKTGEWIGTEYDGYADGNPVYYEWECSECGCVIEEEGRPTYNYCPQCGANMRGEADADD